jgi:hypothetical protein
MEKGKGIRMKNTDLRISVSYKFRNDFYRLVEFADTQDSQSPFINSFRRAIGISRQILSSGINKILPEGEFILDYSNNKVYCVYQLKKQDSIPHLTWKYEISDSEIRGIFKESASDFIFRYHRQKRTNKSVNFALVFKSLF